MSAVFPPSTYSTVTKTIPSSLYQEYSDDDDLQAFVAAYNTMVQTYVDWFVTIGLPIYTGPNINGPLLDWVAQGLYGIIRPSLASGLNKNLGPFNTYVLDGLPFNGRKKIGNQNLTVTTDDIFKRVMTWNFYKGDGYQFNVRYLKRRIMRFLLGTNGVSYNVDQTYQVSVTFGLNNQVNISLLIGSRKITGGALFNRFAINNHKPETTFNSLTTSFSPLTPLPNMAVFKEAVDAGVLELPIQYTYIVTI